MKFRAVVLCALCASTAAALLSFAATVDFSFLKEFEDLAGSWHRSATILKILAFLVSVLGTFVAFLQIKNIQVAWKGTVSAVLSLLIAVLNAGLVFFYADSRTYEQAAVKYDSAILTFRTLNEALDIADPQIAQEYSHAKADLIQDLYGIRTNLLEGKSPNLPSIIPTANAQDPKVWRAADTAHYVYAIGAAVDPADLQRAKSAAIQDANQKLIAQLTTSIEQELSAQRLSAESQQRVANLFVNPSANAEILSHAETEKVYFAKDGSGYHFSAIRRILKDVVSYQYLTLLQSQTSATNPPGFSRERFEQFLRSIKAR